MLEKEIEIIGARCLQCRITKRRGRRAAVWREQHRRHQVREVRSGDGHAVSCADVGVGSQHILPLNARQDVGIASTSNNWQGSYIISVNVYDDLIRVVGLIRCFETHARLQARLPETDRIHQVACVDTFGPVVIRSVIIQMSRGGIERECGEIGVDQADDLVVIGERTKLVRVIVVVWVGVRTKNLAECKVGLWIVIWVIGKICLVRIS